MKSILFLTYFLIALCSSSRNYQSEWSNFKQDHEKTYTSQHEESYRFQIFKKNLDFIDKFNAENESPRYGITIFTDLTHEEFMEVTGQNQKLFSGKRVFVGDDLEVEDIKDKLPTEVDWVKRGAVTPIKDQLECGSSPYFGAVVSIEGAWQIAGNPLTSFSEQQILDCTMVAPYNNYGCNGGYMLSSMEYVNTYGIQTEQSYPYVGVNQNCRYNRTLVVGKTAAPVDISSTKEAKLQEALVFVPVATAVDASQFQFYTSGIISAAKCGTLIAHGIGVVGYGVTGDGQEYYILKNTWGTKWGLNGYVWIERNSKTTPACGVTQYCSYAVVDKTN